METPAVPAAIAPALDAFLAHVNRTLAAAYGETDAKVGWTTRAVLEVGPTYARLVRCETLADGSVNGRSAMGFVALVDGETRTLGAYKAGDLLKSASWKAPARGVRGSILAPETWRRCSAYGIA
jgi:hypothetical protein